MHDPRPFASDVRSARWYVSFGLPFLLLLPLLFFPLGPDESAFFIGGRKLLQGAIYYRDVIDVKPPLIHYLYSAAIFLFGAHERSIFILDYILQSATCALMIALVTRASGEALWGLASALSYAVLYIAMGFQNVAQPESYVGLFALTALYLLLRARGRIAWVGIGISCGILFLFKYTLLIVFPGVIISAFLLFPEIGRRELLIRSALATAGLLVTALLLFCYPLVFGVWNEFDMLRHYTSRYAGEQWRHPLEWLMNSWKKIPELLVTVYSLLLLLSTGVGVGLSLRSREGTSASGGVQLLRICSIILIFLALSVCIEGRYYPYQFSRVFPFGAIIGSFGLIRLLRGLARARSREPYYRLLLGMTLVLFFLCTPLIRYGWSSLPALLKITRGEIAYDNYFAHMLDGLSRVELKTIARYIDAHRKPGEKIFAASNVAGMLYVQADYVPDFELLFSPTVTSPLAPLSWRARTEEYFRHEIPKFVITQHGDARHEQTGTEQDSEGALRSIGAVDSLLRTRYGVVEKTSVFDLYERRDTE